MKRRKLTIFRWTTQTLRETCNWIESRCYCLEYFKRVSLNVKNRIVPCNPAGTEAGVDNETPLPATRPRPGPGVMFGTLGKPSSGGGGPSIVIETIDSPRNNTKPSTRFSSRSGNLLFLGRIFRNSSQSPRIRFMCLSNALNVPISVRESCSTMRTR